MPYKIYTYEDPYRLNETDFWEEIAGLPHFCGARTLVNGLKSALGNKIKGLICPLDDMVSHKEVYGSWTHDINRRIEQYSRLSALFNQLLKREEIDEYFHKALTKNQSHFLDAIRLFIELDIADPVMDKTKGNREQKLFVQVLKDARRNSIFRFPKTPDRENLKKIIVELAKQEVTDCTGPEQEKRRCEEAEALTKRQPLDTIVIHGVHQFSPAELRLIIDLEKMGFTIIFLFNYQEKYPSIYASWYDIYSCFDTPFHHDAAVKGYQTPEMQNASNALACALGELCEERGGPAGPRLQDLQALYRDVKFIEFANITEYAHFVSNHVEKAKQEYADSRSVLSRGQAEWNHAAVLSRLNEQVYTANRDIHTLLKIYYPEYAKDRHFLSYPVGQFFSAIYRLWDYEKEAIKFDIPAIKECLSSNILSAGRGEILLRTFCNLDVLFNYITTFEEFEKEIAGKYRRNYRQVKQDVESARRCGEEPPDRKKFPLLPLQQMEIYNSNRVREKDIDALVKAVEEINDIAKNLFANGQTQEDYIHFGEHFKKLEDFLRQRELTLASEQERVLIGALQRRLDDIKPEKSRFSGTFKDLRESLGFYLQEKDEEDEPGADWIVKNFEQIDGDVLQSAKQVERDIRKVYHFACLSDQDMNKTVNDQLPWPLTEEFIRAAYDPIDLQFQVYHTALGERSSFLRYALFYGLYYNRSKACLSFVKQCGDEIAEPYALLTILGIKAEKGIVEQANPASGLIRSISTPQVTIEELPYDSFQMMDMLLCPYRYFLDYVMEDSPVAQGDFQYRQYYTNLLIERLWTRISGQPKDIAKKYFNAAFAQEVKRFRTFFGFWKDTELSDQERKARNYLKNQPFSDNGPKVRSADHHYLKIRRQFGMAMFGEALENDRKHPYAAFEPLIQKQDAEKVYSLPKLPRTPYPAVQKRIEQICEAARQYIQQEQDEDQMAFSGSWCNYCAHRGICMEPFLADDSAK